MSPRARISGWDSWHRQAGDGAVESEQRVTVSAPVVAFTDSGARALVRAYWSEVERAMMRLVRPHPHASGIDLCVLGRWAALLSFGAPEVEVSPSVVACRYPIAGGVLAQRPQGDIRLAQTAGDGFEIRSTIRDLLPALAAHEGEPHWTGALYDQVQSRIHVAISRRYFARLIRETRP
jgi:hypothetical protein